MPIFPDFGSGSPDKTSKQTDTTKQPAQAQSPEPAQTSQLDDVQARIAGLTSTLSSARLFDVLEAIRDQMGDLRAQNEQIRNDVMDLQRVVFEVNG